MPYRDVYRRWDAMDWSAWTYSDVMKTLLHFKFGRLLAEIALN